MRLLSSLLPLVLLCNSITPAVAGGGHLKAGLDKAMAMQRTNRERLHQMFSYRTPDSSAGRVVRKRKDGSPVTFANKVADQFHVDGTKIPDGTFILCPYEL